MGLKLGSRWPEKAAPNFKISFKSKLYLHLDSRGAGTHVLQFLRYLKRGGFEDNNAYVHLESATSSLAWKISR
jgi:hypothetical protein